MKTRSIEAVALDMDGTALTSKGTIAPETEKAIHEAMAQGVSIVFCSGRSLVKMEDLLSPFPDLRYMIAESGALVYDLQKKEILSVESLPRTALKSLHSLIDEKEILIQAFSHGIPHMPGAKVQQLPLYNKKPYKGYYDTGWTIVPGDSLLEYLEENEMSVEKLNLIHKTPEAREKTMALLKENHLDLEYAYSEVAVIETTPKSLTKATGLRKLAAKAGWKMEEIVMVGDGENDMEATKQAGCAIAMRTAEDKVKAIADLVGT
ncbi:MAG: HAD-IIB family hydrolase, partial [Spirochaetales bacterium]|nr:HAD-IIB family hydrolase [Candidatus Physcosoma equi]